ncbi:hypothetical protein ABIC87_002351 [Chitinophaga ginsengisegetis]
MLLNLGDAMCRGILSPGRFNVTAARYLYFRQYESYRQLSRQ